LCGIKTSYQDLNEALGNLHAKKESFRRVLDRPGLPLHNNLSENEIRAYARLRKISGGTPSDAGLRCHDTFMSLKKSCRKLGVSFGAFLQDRLSGSMQIPQLSALVRQSAASRSGGFAIDPGQPRRAPRERNVCQQNKIPTRVQSPGTVGLLSSDQPINCTLTFNMIAAGRLPPTRPHAYIRIH